MAELIVALDFPESSQLLLQAKKLAGLVPWVKVGLESFVLAGPKLINELTSMGFKVFLDLKFYDIPNTAAGAVQAAAKTGASLLTIHCQGGKAMCQAALAAAKESANADGERPLIFGVTALTSFGKGMMPGISKDPSEFALDLAALAAESGLDGVVCSAQEAATIKANFPLLALCPGIRPAGSDVGDQARVCTPSQAVHNGADFLVVGRPITRASDPALAAQNILAEMAN